MEFLTASTFAIAWPSFLSTLSTPVLRQQVGLIRWLAVCMGFAGIVLVMSPEVNVFSWYALFPLCATFFYASNSGTASLKVKSISTLFLNLYICIGAPTSSAVLEAVRGCLVEVILIRD